MNTKRLLIIVALLGLLFTLNSCNKLQGAMKTVEGKVGGMVLNDAGIGRGYIRVALEPTDPSMGDTIFTMTEDAGNFLFETVPPGEYKMKAMLNEANELPSDNPIVKVSPGRTLMKNIMLSNAPATP